MKRSQLKDRPPPGSPSDDEVEEQARSAKRRIGTVYDAVAGRLNQWGFVDPTATPSTTNRLQPLRPDEILFKAKKAPTRYEEDDYYFAHNRLPEDQKLPSGDLLSALHAYIANFYARSEERVNAKVWKSMDETALIALGILMEETAKEVLGHTGDLAFTEGLDDDEDEDEGEEGGENSTAKGMKKGKQRSMQEEDEALDASLSENSSQYGSEESE